MSNTTFTTGTLIASSWLNDVNSGTYGGTAGNVLTATGSGNVATWQNATSIATALESATTTVNVSSATAPTSGQVLTATGGTAATWQNPTAITGLPAFSAYNSASQTIPTTSQTKLVFNTKDFDVTNAFDATTNYRFTPLVAGYYQVTGALVISPVNTLSTLYLYKNGSAFKKSSNPSNPGTNYCAIAISAIVYLNGSTDYIELFIDAGGLSGYSTNASGSTWFQASLVTR